MLRERPVPYIPYPRKMPTTTTGLRRDASSSIARTAMEGFSEKQEHLFRGVWGSYFNYDFTALKLHAFLV